MIILSIICTIALFTLVYFGFKSMDKHYNEKWKIYKFKGKK